MEGFDAKVPKRDNFSLEDDDDDQKKKDGGDIDISDDEAPDLEAAKEKIRQ